MDNMKKRIFIGSSSEEQDKAKIVKGLLDKDFDVTIWDEKVWDKSVFKLNNNFMNDLLVATLKFDFGILLGTKDDKVEVRGKEYLAPRDNILFELGLFIGRLGLENCAFLVDKEIKIPSDLDGLFLSRFDDKNFYEKIEGIRDKFLHADNKQLNFFPSSVLASTYYENFVKYVCEAKLKENGFEFKGKKYEKCKLRIIVPNILTDNLYAHAKKIQNKIGVKEMSFDAMGRTRTVSVDATINNEVLIIVDVPTIVTGIYKAIEHLLPKEFRENKHDYEMIMKRELNRFVDTLKSVVKRNGHDDFVIIELEELNKG